jgi:hypothetical protein
MKPSRRPIRSQSLHPDDLKGFKECRVQGVKKICSVPIYWGRIKENFVGSTCLPAGRNADAT